MAEGHSTVRQRLVRGAGASAVGQIANAFIQLCSVPLFLWVWGTARYGEWLILSSLTAYLAMSDLGFASVAANDMTMRVGRGDRDGALVVYQSVWALLALIAVLLLPLAFGLLWLTDFCNWLPLQQTTSREAAVVLLTLSVSMICTLLWSVIAAGFRCDGHYAFGTLLTTLQRIVEFMGQVVAVLVTHSMIAVALSGLVIRCMFILVGLAIVRRLSPWLSFGFRYATKSTIRSLIRPALSYLLFPLGNAISLQGSVQVIGAILGASSVVVFTAHRTMCNVPVQLMNAISLAVWPELSVALGAGNLELGRRLHRTACQYCIWISTGACAGVSLLAPWFLPFWTSGRIGVVPNLLAIMLAVVLLRTVWYTSSMVPASTNRHEPVAVLYVAGTMASVALACLLMMRFGLAGAAFAQIVTELVVGTYVVRASLALTQDTFREFVRRIVRPPIGPFAVAA